MMRLVDALPEVMERLHHATRTRQTDLADDCVELKADVYLDPQIFQRELALISKQARPLIAIGNLPPKGEMLAVDSGRESFIVGCDSKSGEMAVFRNRCRHRGAKLLNAGNECKKIASCPYHAWTYNSKGELMGIPGDGHGIKDFSSLNLERVPSFLAGGFLWIGIKSEEIANFSEELSLLGIESPQKVAEFSFDGNFNWKTGVESFLEIYHFKFAHQKYLSNLPMHNVALVDFGHAISRTLIPLNVFEGNDLEAFKKNCHLMYFIFPNHFFLVFDDHFGWLTIDAKSIDHTEILYRGFTFLDNASQVARKKVESSVKLLRDLVAEDVAICEDIHSQMRPGDTFKLTRFEPAIGHFHTRASLNY